MMKKRAHRGWRGVVFWLCLLSGLGVVSEVWACQAPAREIMVREWSFWPRAGATQIPTNTRFLIVVKKYGRYDPQHGELRKALSTYELRETSSQKSIPAAVESWEYFGSTWDSEHWAARTDENYLLKPKTLLKPNTDYELVNRVASLPCSSSEEDHGHGVQTCSLGKARVIATFTTASGADTDAPGFGGLGSSQQKAVWGNEDGLITCGPRIEDHIAFSLRWTPAKEGWTEGSFGVRYHIYEASDLKKPLRRFVNATEIQSSYGCKSGWAVDAGFGIGKYVARAVDVAGNVDKNQKIIEINDACNKLDEKAAPPRHRKPKDRTGMPTPGCSTLSRSAGMPGPSALLALGLMLLGARRLRSAPKG